MSEIALRPETIDVGGRDVWAVMHDGEIRVVLPYCCDSLGVKTQPQKDKLEKRTWSKLTDTRMFGMDGKVRNLKTMPLKALPMWLANIDENKVADDVRPALVAWQEQAVDILAAHFFGPQPVPGQPLSPAYTPGLYLPEETHVISNVWRNLKSLGFEHDMLSFFDYVHGLGWIYRATSKGKWISTRIGADMGYVRNVGGPVYPPRANMTQRGMDWVRDDLSEMDEICLPENSNKPLALAGLV